MIEELVFDGTWTGDLPIIDPDELTITNWLKELLYTMKVHYKQWQ